MKKLILSIVLVSLSYACGLFISTDQSSSPASVGNSVALIELAQNYEELSFYVHVEYYDGDENFAWLIPLPAMPEVSSPNYSIFEGLSKISAPTYISRKHNDFGCSYYEGTGQEDYGRDYYEILQHETISPQFFNTLYAEAVDTIVAWLEYQGITLPSQSQNLIQEYIDKGWNYFYIAIFGGDFYGAKVGIKFRFASNEEVVSMHIARTNEFLYHYGYYYDENCISMYTYSISNHKKTYSLGKLVYANSLNQNEIDAINEDFPTLGSKLESGDYVTKLEISYVEPNQSIIEDIVLQNAPDDDEYREFIEEYSYWYFAINPLFILLAVLLLRQKIKVKSVNKLSNKSTF